MGPTLGFDTTQRNGFIIKFGDFFTIKNKILTILFMVKYEKIILFDKHCCVFLVLLGFIISRLFTCSNEEKNKQKQQRVRALVLFLWSNLIETVPRLPSSPTRIVPLFPPMVVFVAMVAATPFPSCKS